MFILTETNICSVQNFLRGNTDELASILPHSRDINALVLCEILYVAFGKIQISLSGLVLTLTHFMLSLQQALNAHAC